MITPSSPPAKRPCRFESLWLGTLLLLVPVRLALAQTVAAKPGSPPATAEPAIVLSPFEVSADADQGYAASSALAGTRTNEKLANLPNSISVFTADLMRSHPDGVSPLIAMSEIPAVGIRAHVTERLGASMAGGGRSPAKRLAERLGQKDA